MILCFVEFFFLFLESLDKSSSFVTKKKVVFVFCALCLLPIINVKYIAQIQIQIYGLNCCVLFVGLCCFVVLCFGVMPKEGQREKANGNES